MRRSIIRVRTKKTVRTLQDWLCAQTSHWEQFLINELYETLLRLYKESEKPFPGIGILVCNDLENIPVFPLYKTSPSLVSSNLYDGLLQISSLQSAYHDGFHVLSEKLKVTHAAQYFYPSPIPGMELDAHKHYGARYFVAKIGSMLPDVHCSAIVGSNYGVCVFEKGKLIKSYNND